MKFMKACGFKLLLIIPFAFMFTGCEQREHKGPKSDSGITKVSAKVQTGADGMTMEQRNVRARLELEKPGSIQHLYVIAPMSGQVLLYSTVKGKVSSSGKRLTPKQSAHAADLLITGIKDYNGGRVYTNEILGDDGTYGSSNPYIYWFDPQGRYHQHFFTGGQIIHISNHPIAVKNIVLNLETTKQE